MEQDETKIHKNICVKTPFFFTCVGNFLHFSSIEQAFRISIAALDDVSLVLCRTLCSLISVAILTYRRFLCPTYINH
jgi:hypothetical protein